MQGKNPQAIRWAKQKCAELRPFLSNLPIDDVLEASKIFHPEIKYAEFASRRDKNFDILSPTKKSTEKTSYLALIENTSKHMKAIESSLSYLVSELVDYDIGDLPEGFLNTLKSRGIALKDAFSTYENNQFIPNAEDLRCDYFIPAALAFKEYCQELKNVVCTLKEIVSDPAEVVKKKDPPQTRAPEKSRVVCLDKEPIEKISALIRAAKYGDLETVKDFLNENIGWLTVPLNADKQSLIHIASLFNCKDIIEYINQTYGSDAHPPALELDRFGMSPISYAAIHGDKELGAELSAFYRKSHPKNPKSIEDLIAPGIKNGGIDFIMSVSHSPRVKDCFKTEAHRKFLTTSRDVVRLLRANHELGDVLFQDQRIKALVQNDEVSIGELIPSLPKAMLLKYQTMLSSFIMYQPHQSDGFFGRLKDCFTNRRYPGFFKRLGAFLRDAYKKKLDQEYNDTFSKSRLTGSESSVSLAKGYIAQNGLFGQPKDLDLALKHFKDVDGSNPIDRMKALWELANIYAQRNETNQIHHALDELLTIANDYLRTHPFVKSVIKLNKDAIALKDKFEIDIQPNGFYQDRKLELENAKLWVNHKSDKKTHPVGLSSSTFISTQTQSAERQSSAVPRPGLHGSEKVARRLNNE